MWTLPGLSAPLSLVLFMLAGIAAAPASAAYDERCWVQLYLPWRGSWSETFEVTCTYATGRELNERVGGRRFASYKEYAIITGAFGPPTTIRITQSLSCGFVAEAPCAEQISHLLTGRDEFSYWRQAGNYAANGRSASREFSANARRVFSRPLALSAETMLGARQA